jgi:hypothetical protein
MNDTVIVSVDDIETIRELVWSLNHEPDGGMFLCEEAMDIYFAVVDILKELP